MENQQHSSEYKLSFPIIPHEEESFEFLADHFFFNGKLQPHVFPIQPPNNPTLNFSHISPSTSRSSSVRSIDCSFSSRSNSTNSISSSCRNGRTNSITESSGSGSDSERKLSFNHRPKVSAAHRRKNILSSEENSFWKQYYKQGKKPALNTTDFGSSLRWQFITPVPDFKSQSGRSTKLHNVELEKKGKVNFNVNGNSNGAGAWLGRSRAIRLFIMACLSCHAFNPAGADQ